MLEVMRAPPAVGGTRVAASCSSSAIWSTRPCVAAALERRCPATAARISSARPERHDAAAHGTGRWRRCARGTAGRCSRSLDSAARTPGTLLAAICSPWPLPPSTTPRSASPVGHRPADRGADRRVVDGLLAVGAEVDHLVASSLQRRDEVLLQREAGVVGADAIAHLQHRSPRSAWTRRSMRSSSSCAPSLVDDRAAADRVGDVVVGRRPTRSARLAPGAQRAQPVLERLVRRRGPTASPRRTSSLSVKRAASLGPSSDRLAHVLARHAEHEVGARRAGRRRSIRLRWPARSIPRSAMTSTPSAGARVAAAEQPGGVDVASTPRRPGAAAAGLRPSASGTCCRCRGGGRRWRECSRSGAARWPSARRGDRVPSIPGRRCIVGVRPVRPAARRGGRRSSRST